MWLVATGLDSADQDIFIAPENSHVLSALSSQCPCPQKTATLLISITTIGFACSRTLYKGTQMVCALVFGFFYTTYYFRDPCCCITSDFSFLSLSGITLCAFVVCILFVLNKYLVSNESRCHRARYTRKSSKEQKGFRVAN